MATPDSFICNKPVIASKKKSSKTPFEPLDAGWMNFYIKKYIRSCHQLCQQLCQCCGLLPPPYNPLEPGVFGINWLSRSGFWWSMDLSSPLLQFFQVLDSLETFHSVLSCCGTALIAQVHAACFDRVSEALDETRSRDDDKGKTKRGR